jgi:hypothetical protein
MFQKIYLYMSESAIRRIAESVLPRELADNAKEALKYWSELKSKGHEEDADELLKFLSNAVKKQATKQALLKLKQTVGEFIFDAKLKISEISELIGDAKGEIPLNKDKRRNPFCKHRENSLCEFCSPPEVTSAEMDEIMKSLEAAIDEKRSDFRDRNQREENWTHREAAPNRLPLFLQKYA